MMKHVFFLALLALQTVAVWADETYPYLILTRSDGTQTAVAVEQLEMTFSGGQLVARNAAGEAAFTLTDLASMQFSQTKDGVESGICENAQFTIHNSQLAGTAFDLTGRQMVNGKWSNGKWSNGKWSNGKLILVRKADGSTSKILVK